MATNRPNDTLRLSHTKRAADLCPPPIRVAVAVDLRYAICYFRTFTTPSGIAKTCQAESDDRNRRGFGDNVIVSHHARKRVEVPAFCQSTTTIENGVRIVIKAKGHKDSTS